MKQLTFAERPRKDGKPRKRPGRKPGARRGVPHAKRPRHSRWNPIHITLRAVSGLPSFRQQVLYRAFLTAFRTTRRAGFRIVEFSVQSNHLHLVVEADDNDALARGMKSFTVRSNRLFNVASGRKAWTRLVRPISSKRPEDTAPVTECPRLRREQRSQTQVDHVTEARDRRLLERPVVPGLDDPAHRPRGTTSNRVRENRIAPATLAATRPHRSDRNAAVGLVILRPRRVDGAERDNRFEARADTWSPPSIRIGTNRCIGQESVPITHRCTGTSLVGLFDAHDGF